MGKNVFCLPMLIIFLAFGMTVVGCNDDPGNLNTEGIIDGTWVWAGNPQLELTFENGTFMASFDGTKMEKGAYSTNKGKLTMEIVELHGSYLNGGSLKGTYNITVSPDKWYPKDELKALKTNDADFDEYIEGRFPLTQTKYSFKGDDSLILTSNVASIAYTRKN